MITSLVDTHVIQPIKLTRHHFGDMTTLHNLLFNNHTPLNIPISMPASKEPLLLYVVIRAAQDIQGSLLSCVRV